MLNVLKIIAPKTSLLLIFRTGKSTMFAMVSRKGSAHVSYSINSNENIGRGPGR